ncbi:MAG: family 20 glycosylhydrolase [Sedimentisphaerales bacterium]
MTIRDESYFAGLVVPVKKVSSRYSMHDARYSRIKNQGSRIEKREWGSSLKTYRDKNIANPEGYRLNITQEAIEVFAKTDAGEYYALQTLQDLAARCGENLPVCEIEDEPDFRRRGVYLDCSRGKVPKLETLKELATWLSHWKINEIQLYIENVFTFKKHPDIGDGYSPFTPDEIIDFQEHCRRHHIRLVGSLASFGHFEKILALPKYRHLGEMPGFRGFPGSSTSLTTGGTTLCPIDPGSIKLIEELYSEFVPLFEAEDFNVCCDETWELGKGRSREEALRVGVGRVYLDFLLKIHRLCEKHGKRMNAWADIILKHPELLSELPRDIVLLNWEYEQDGANIARTGEIANAGLPVMVCPGTSSWLTHGTRLPNSMGNVTNFAAEGRKYDAEGFLNTDWGDNGHRNFLGVSLHGFAHGAANSWNGKAVDNAKFTENFCGSAFGQHDNRMAESIKLLGSTYIVCGKTIPNASLLFQSLFEPILRSEPTAISPIDIMSEQGLRQILAQLSDESVWPANLESADNFEQLALQELKLAARLDCLASERALAAKALRANQNVKKSELQRLSTQMRDAGNDFEELWLARNKLSRLNDNLLLFQQAERELAK